MCGWRACLWVAWLPGDSTPQLGVSTCPHPSHTSRRLRLPGVLSGGWGCCPSLGQRKLLCGLCWRLCSRRTESTSFACIPGAVLCILGHDTKQVQNHRKPCLDCVWRPDLLAELRQERQLEPGSQRNTGQSAGCRGSGPARGLHWLRL